MASLQSGGRGGEEEGTDRTCSKCGGSNNPLMPGKEKLCPQCMHRTQLDRLNDLEQVRLDNEQGAPEESKPLFNQEEVRQMACEAVGLMMKSRKKGRKFQPTYDDVKVIEMHAPFLCSVLRKGSLSQFHTILYPKNELEGTIFDVFRDQDKNHKACNDQLQRAETLVVEMIKREAKRVILLDGHGVMLLSVIHVMLQNDLSLAFEVVDNDEECHSFHEHFFPESVKCIYKDVCHVKLGKTDMLYLNFCSIPPRNTNILFNKEEVLKWIWDHMKWMQCGIMISATLRDTRTSKEIEENITAEGPKSGCRHLKTTGFEKCLEDPDVFGAIVVSKRDNSLFEFKTWLITPEKCVAKNSPDNLQKWFEQLDIVWDCKCEFQPGVLVRVKSGKHKNLENIYQIKRRTPDRVELLDSSGKPFIVSIDDLELVSSVEDLTNTFQKMEPNKADGDNVAKKLDYDEEDSDDTNDEKKPDLQMGRE